MAQIQMPERKSNAGAYSLLGTIGGALIGGPAGAAVGGAAGGQLAGGGDTAASYKMVPNGTSQVDMPQAPPVPQMQQEEMPNTSLAMQRKLENLNRISAQSSRTA